MTNIFKPYSRTTDLLAEAIEDGNFTDGAVHKILQDLRSELAQCLKRRLLTRDQVRELVSRLPEVI